jgi:D-amino peptidase
MSLKIYLFTDLEGVAGVDRWDARDSDRPADVRRCRETRELLMAEVNAATDGAFAGGATAVVLVQGHADSVVYELADERLEIIKGADYPTWLPELGADFGAAFFVGAHALCHTPQATLAHTFNFKKRRQWWLGGREIGELGMLAAYCGAHGVPLALATGDDKLCREARELIPEIETAQVKVGLGIECARHLSRQRACEEIRMAALRAVERVAKGGIPPYRPPGPPYVVRFRSRRRHMHVPRSPRAGERWLSPYEVEFIGDDLREVMSRLTFFY